MILKNEDRQVSGFAERVGKVFEVTAEGRGRRCLICEKTYSRQESYEHSKTVCYPPASSTN
jgi:hypothetical protein